MDGEVTYEYVGDTACVGEECELGFKWFKAYQMTPPGCILAPIASLEDFETIRSLRYPNGPAFDDSCSPSEEGAPFFAHLGVWKPDSVLELDSEHGPHLGLNDGIL